MAVDFHICLIALYGVENAGVRYLSAYLKKHGYKVSIIFFREWRNNNNEYPTEGDRKILVELLLKLMPDLVGLSFISSFFPIARDLTVEIKEKVKAPVLWGGIHATTLPEESLQWADYVCIGEGEGPLLDLAGALSHKISAGKIENIWLRDGRDVAKNPIRPLIENLDSLELPDYENEDKYLIDSGRTIEGDPARNGAEYRIYTSRGCPFDCSYCYNSVLRRIYQGKGRYFRHRSPAHVIGELEEAKKNFPRLRRVKIDDDTAFAFGEEWLEEFCRLYKEKIKMPFECLIQPQLLDEGTLEKLKDAGIVKVQVGIEGASDREMKEAFHRQPAPEKILQFVEWNKKLKLEVVFDVIIDNPLSTDEDRQALFDLLMKIPLPYKLYLYSLVIFPGTAMAEELLKSGKITPDDVEGVSTKGMRQFRASADWPRPPEDRYWLSLFYLVSKEFVPRGFLKWLSGVEHFKKSPGLLFAFAQGMNLLKMGQVGMDMLFRGEMTGFKLRQYGDLRKMISQ